MTAKQLIKSIEGKGIKVLKAEGNIAILRVTNINILNKVITIFAKFDIEYKLIDPVTFKIEA